MLRRAHLKFLSSVEVNELSVHKHCMDEFIKYKPLFLWLLKASFERICILVPRMAGTFHNSMLELL